MNKQQVRDRIVEVGIVPVIRAQSSEQALMAVSAVCSGDIPIVEITMTVPGAVALIAKIVKEMGSSVLVGAGTVLDVDTARQCVQAGAQFLVSPGFDVATVKFAQESNVLVMAGALTPTEVMAAWKAGADLLKIFPSGEVGGPNYIRALRGPFPQVPMIPTGGVNLKNVADFIHAGASALGIGGELVSPAALGSGDNTTISRNAKAFACAVREARNPAAACAL